METLRKAILFSDIEKARKIAIVSWLVILSILVTIEALRGSYYWSKFKGNFTLFDWESAVHYIIASQIAIVNGILIRYRGRFAVSREGYRAWIPWIVTGIAGAFFATDEMIEIHERLGRRIETLDPSYLYFFPAGGDTVVTASYVLIGAACGILFFNRMFSLPKARIYALFGVGVLALVAGMDITPERYWIDRMPFRETKELLELLLGWLMGSAFLTVAAHTMVEILRLSEPSQVSE